MGLTAACDVGDAGDALPLLAHMVYTGVLHAAGVLQDRMLRLMTTADVDTVFTSKAHGASYVQTILVCKPLEAFALFSSVASALGNIG